jgi:linoleate 10R-lipoxygenase
VSTRHTHVTLIIGFNRFHNSVIRELASINEGGRFSLPNLQSIESIIRVTQPELTDSQIAAAAKDKFDNAMTKRDNDLFQTGRLYNFVIIL